MKLHRHFAIVVVAALTAPLIARADLQVEEQTTDEGQLTVFKMTVTPAPEPTPALKHRLLLRDLDEQEGNAAPFYYRAIMAAPAVTKALHDKFGGEYTNWISESGPGWPMEKVRSVAALIPDSSMIANNLREAATRRECDWGWRLDAIRGPDLYMFLLPEIQESRQLSRFLALRARMAIAEGRYDDALDELRINFKLGRDVASAPILVCGLVGIAEASIGNRVLIDLIAAPDSPNLYWALTELPDPPIDLRRATRFEMGAGFRIFPFMIDAEKQEHSPEEWSRLLARGFSDLGTMTNGSISIPNETVARMGVAGLALATYGPAKQRLIDAGMDSARVEQMAVGQVIAIDAAQEYLRISDEFEKRWYLPHREALDQAERFVDPLGPSKFDRGYGGILASLLVPALNAARQAQVRLDWQTDALRTVEAIRMHAAATGKMPRSLDEITVVPAPENPATGEPFDYRLDGDTAVLKLPFSDGFAGVAWRFEIKLAN